MYLRRIPALFLAVALQVLPVARVVQSIQLGAPSAIVIMLRLASAAAAMLGGVHAVSGASTTINSPTTATGTNGVAFTYRITTGPQVANTFAATPLPTGLVVSATTGRITGTPTQTGVFTVALTASDSGIAARTVHTNLALTIVSGSVVVVTSPTITTQPVTQTVNAGSSVTLSVVATTGGGTLAYQWTKGGVNISGATSSSLTLNPVAASDAATYAVVVSNSAGSVTSSGAVLTVISAPTITTQPLTQTANAGANVTLSVVATTGGGTLAYQWTKGGVNVSGATSSSLALTAVTSASAATYAVVVSNAAGSVTSSGAVLTVISAPTITTQPLTQTVNAGASVTLSVVATTGGGTLGYQWTKGGVNVSGATSSSLTLNPVAASDAATYAVVVSNAAGSVTSSGAVLTVISAPTITTQPLTQTANAGANVTLSVVATTGGGTLAYQWTKGGVNVSGATSSSLALTAVTSASAATYAVVVSNAAGSVTSSGAVLTVISAPTITTQPLTQTANAGANVTLSVVATTGGGTLSYQWTKGGVNISGAISASLTLTAVSATDAATYAVVVSNAAGSVTSSGAVLTVISVPTITTQPLTQTVTAGANVTLSVVATTGGGTLTYQWKKGGVNVSGATSASLALTAVTTGDSATYTVVVSNAAGSATSSGAVLTVSAVVVAAGIGTGPSSQTATVGSNVTFSVVATGTTPITYQWLKGGVNISGATSSSYTITGVVSGDAGNYTVTVSNSGGSATSSAAVLTVITPPSITTQPATQTVTAPASVSFTVAASGTAPLTYQWKKGGVNISGATSTSYTINPTSTSDAGTYTVTVSNSGGSVTSSGAVLSVIAAPVAPSITTQPVSQTVTSGASVSFTVAASGTSPFTYQWKFGGVDIAGATSATLSLTSVTNGNAGSYTVLVGNVAGSVLSSAAVLTVNVAPTVTTQPRTTLANAGANVNLSVVAAGTAPLSYQWLKGGTNIAGATSSTLGLTGITTSDNGSYTVQISNVAGSVTSLRALLVVRPPPTVVTNPLTQLRFVGDTVEFSVVAVGAAPLSYQWTHAGTNLPAATSNVLTLPSITLQSGGAYAALVANSVGSVTSRVAYLIVRPAPVTPPPADTAVPANLAPVSSPVAQGQSALGTNYSQFVVLPPGQTQTVVVFDASASTDPDHDALAYLWETQTAPGTFQAFSQSIISTNTLGEGSFSIRLTVGDATHRTAAALDLSVVAAASFGQTLVTDLGGLAAGTNVSDAVAALQSGDSTSALSSLGLALTSIDADLQQGVIPSSRHAALSEGVRRLSLAVQSAQ